MWGNWLTLVDPLLNICFLSRKAFYMSFCVEGPLLHTFLLSSSHKSTIGLRSGLCGGPIYVFKTPILCLYVLNSPCILLNFAWGHYITEKIHFQLILNHMKGHFIVLFILLMIPLTHTKSLVPCPDNHPQIIMEPPAVGSKQFGIILSSVRSNNNSSFWMKYFKFSFISSKNFFFFSPVLMDKGPLRLFLLILWL